MIVSCKMKDTKGSDDIVEDVKNVEEVKNVNEVPTGVPTLQSQFTGLGGSKLATSAGAGASSLLPKKQMGVKKQVTVVALSEEGEEEEDWGNEGWEKEGREGWEKKNSREGREGREGWGKNDSVESRKNNNSVDEVDDRGDARGNDRGNDRFVGNDRFGGVRFLDDGLGDTDDSLEEDHLKEGKEGKGTKGGKSNVLRGNVLGSPKGDFSQINPSSPKSDTNHLQNSNTTTHYEELFLGWDNDHYEDSEYDYEKNLMVVVPYIMKLEFSRTPIFSGEFSLLWLKLSGKLSFVGGIFFFQMLLQFGLWFLKDNSENGEDSSKYTEDCLNQEQYMFIRIFACLLWLILLPILATRIVKSVFFYSFFAFDKLVILVQSIRLLIVEYWNLTICWNLTSSSSSSSEDGNSFGDGNVIMTSTSSGILLPFHLLLPFFDSVCQYIFVSFFWFSFDALVLPRKIKSLLLLCLTCAWSIYFARSVTLLADSEDFSDTIAKKQAIINLTKKYEWYYKALGGNDKDDKDNKDDKDDKENKEDGGNNKDYLLTDISSFSSSGNFTTYGNFTATNFTTSSFTKTVTVTSKNSPYNSTTEIFYNNSTEIPYNNTTSKNNESKNSTSKNSNSSKKSNTSLTIQNHSY